MANRNIDFLEDEFFHIYNRGNSKQDIYHSAADYRRFINTLYLANTTKRFNIRDLQKNNEDIFLIERPDNLVKIGAYCLMPNHFHLLLSPIVEGGVSKFMQKLATSYSMYINTKYDRTGSLFEGKFKAKHVSNDRYLKYLFSYIHLNPVAIKDTQKNTTLYPAGSFEKALAYPYSSLFNYISPRSDLGLEKKVIESSLFELYFSNTKDIETEIFSWLEAEPNDNEPALGRT